MTAKKATVAPKKTVAVKEAPVKEAEVVKEAKRGKELLAQDIADQAKKAWEAEGHRASSIKSLDIYVKPEEFAAYYVINGKDTGKVEL